MPRECARRAAVAGNAKTDVLSGEVAAWPSPPMERLDPIRFFDAIQVKVHDQGTVPNKAAYLALDITPDGRKHVLGLSFVANKGVKFWRQTVSHTDCSN